MIAPILSRPDLLVTRNVEWANLALGFEQVGKYVANLPVIYITSILLDFMSAWKVSCFAFSSDMLEILNSVCE